MTTKLIPLKDVGNVPGWPHSSWVTGQLIRDGKLGRVGHGRRVYVTEELLQAFIARHTVQP